MVETEDLDDRLLSLAKLVCDRETIHWEAEGGQLSEEDREVAAVLAALARLQEAVPDESTISSSGSLGTWGPYELLSVTGSGATGRVFRAYDPPLDREVALKLRTTPDSEEERENIFREGRLLARVQHPNIASVYTVDEYGGRLGLVIELIEGATLDEIVLTSSRLSTKEASMHVTELCRALAALHRASIVHRDVKAENVIRSTDGRIVLLDFGIGFDADRDHFAGQISGTPLYMAPEILAGGEPTPSSDLYSVGVLLYFLVSGKFPLETDSLEDLLEAHEKGAAVPLRDVCPSVPQTYASIVERCLDRDPNRRPASAGALEKSLLETMTSEPTGAWRRVRSSMAQLGFALAVAAAVAGYFTLRGDRANRPMQGGGTRTNSIAEPDGPSLDEVRRIVIGEIQAADPALGHGIGVILQTALDRSGYIEIAAPETADSEPACRDGVSAVTTGSIIQANDYFEFNFTVRSCADPQVDLYNLYRSPRTLDDLLSLIDQETGSIEAALGLDPSPPDTSLWVLLPRGQPFRYYVDGLRFLRDEDYERATDALKDAIQFDPTFAMAHVHLTRCYLLSQDTETAFHHAEEAYKLRENLAEQQRFWVEATYLSRAFQFGLAESAARQLTDKYPSNRDGYALLANIYSRQHEFARAIGTQRKALRADPSVHNLARLAFFYFESGDFVTANFLAKAARQGNSSYANWPEALANIGLDNIEDV